MMPFFRRRWVPRKNGKDFIHPPRFIVKRRKNRRPPVIPADDPPVEVLAGILDRMFKAEAEDAERAHQEMGRMALPETDPRTEAERDYADVYDLLDEKPTMAGVEALKQLEAGEITFEECLNRVEDAGKAFLRAAKAEVDQYRAEKASAKEGGTPQSGEVAS